MRRLACTAAITISLVGCRRTVSTTTTGAATTVSAPAEGAKSYADARRSFHTHLLKHGPSPQAGEPLKVPPGANRIDYTSSSLTLAAFVSPDPQDGKKHPAVVFCHGGFAFGPEDWLDPKPFRDAGYVVLVPVVRGENGQPGEFSTFYDEVDDVLAATDALGRLPYVDSNRIFISGHSAGATLALLAAMARDVYRGVAALSAVLDQRLFQKSSPKLIAYDPTDGVETSMRSPLDFATSLKAPTQIWYGDDERWQVAPSRALAKAATRDGGSAVAMSSPGNHFTFVAGAIPIVVQFFDGLR